VTVIQLAETLAVGSIESFLSPAETADLLAVMDVFLTDRDSAVFGSRRGASIHEIPGHTIAQAMAVYEPAGRVEITTIPEEAELILQTAFSRAQHALVKIVPSVSCCRPWTYVEYGPGQHITAHLDGIAPDPIAWPRQVAGISVVISEPAAGGAFYVETTSDRCLWEHEHVEPGHGYGPGMHLARDGADNSADWFRSMPRTRWRVDPAPGTALLYGSQLAHGTEAVVRGRARKFISWLTTDSDAGGEHAGGH
jgi:hypothetical protein